MRQQISKSLVLHITESLGFQESESTHQVLLYIYIYIYIYICTYMRSLGSSSSSVATVAIIAIVLGLSGIVLAFPQLFFLSCPNSLYP